MKYTPKWSDGSTALANACYYADESRIRGFLTKSAGIKGVPKFDCTADVISWIESLGIDPVYKQHDSYSCGIECCGPADTISLSKDTMLAVLDTCPSAKVVKLAYH